MSDEEEESMSEGFSASEDEWKPTKDMRGGESSDDDDSDVEDASIGILAAKKKESTKSRFTKPTGIKKRKPTGQSLRTKLYNKYRPPPKTISSPSDSPKASTSRTASKNARMPNERGEQGDDNDSSSDSSVDNYLVNPADLDLHSNFFNTMANKSKDTSPAPVFDCNAGLELSNSGSEDNNVSSGNDDDKNTKSKAFDFRNLLEKANSLERAKETIAKRTAAVKKKHKGKDAKAAAMDVNSLLALGEKQNNSKKVNDDDDDEDDDDDDDDDDVERSPLKLTKTKSTRVKRHTKTRPTSTVAAGDTDDSDFEEVADDDGDGDDDDDNDGSKSKAKTTKTANLNHTGNLEIHVEFPGKRSKEKKAQQDFELVLQRKLARAMRTKQVLLHKCSLLCYFARSLNYNRILNNHTLMQASLKLMPSANAFPPKTGTEIKYFQSLVTWYKTAMKLTSQNFYPDYRIGHKNSCAVKLLLEQITKKAASSKQDMIFILVILLRGMGLQCRLVVNMTPLPLKPTNADLESIKIRRDNGPKDKEEATKKSKKDSSEEDKRHRNDEKLSRSKRKDDDNTREKQKEKHEKGKKKTDNKKERLKDDDSENDDYDDINETKAANVEIKDEKLGKNTKPKKPANEKKADDKNAFIGREEISDNSPKNAKRGKRSTKDQENQQKAEQINLTEAEDKKSGAAGKAKKAKKSEESAEENEKEENDKKEEEEETANLEKSITDEFVKRPNKTAHKIEATKTVANSIGNTRKTRQRKIESIDESSLKAAQNLADKSPKETIDKKSRAAAKPRLAKLKHHSSSDAIDKSQSTAAKRKKLDDDKEIEAPKSEQTNRPPNLACLRKSPAAATKTIVKPKIVVNEEPQPSTSAAAKTNNIEKLKISPQFLQSKTYKEKFSPEPTQENDKPKASSLTKSKLSLKFLKEKPKMTTTVKRVLRSRQKSNVESTEIIPQLDGADDVPKSSKRPKLIKLKMNRSKEESDEDFETTVAKKPKPAPVLTKTVQKLRNDRRVLSTDDENEHKHKNAHNMWIEVWCDVEEQWVCVDIFKAKIHAVAIIQKAASPNLAYVYAFNNDLSMKDVTARYCSNWSTMLKKCRVEKAWLDDTIAPYLGRSTKRDKREDEELRRIHEEKPLPTVISEFKDHPLYFLERHLLKFQALHPPEPPILGYVRGEAIYPRDCVHTLHSREIWLKSARTVKLGEKPYKTVKARPKWDRLTQTVIKDLPLELFGYWQTQDYEPPTAENGLVPRNAYGNVELFKACMLPKKTVHLRLPGLQRICKKLNIDCANAVVGFDFHQGACHPMYDGFIICEEYAETVTAAWHEDQANQEAKEREKYEARVYGNWKKLIRGLLVRERLKKKYNF